MHGGMLKRLSVRGFALLSDVAVEFGAGLNVFTGETGAGKSLLLGALAAMVGRGLPTGLAGPGCDAHIDLELSSDVPLRAALRVRDEKVRCFLDQKSVPVGELRRKVGDSLILTAQGAVRELASPAGVLDLLDQRAGTLPLLVEYRAARREVARGDAPGSRPPAHSHRTSRSGSWLPRCRSFRPCSRTPWRRR